MALIRRHATAIRGAMAIGGLVAALSAIALLPPLGQPAPRWAWRFLIAWCVAVPYWHFAEYRFLRDPAQTAAQRQDFIYLQTLSRTVWIGIALVLATRVAAFGSAAQ